MDSRLCVISIVVMKPSVILSPILTTFSILHYIYYFIIYACFLSKPPHFLFLCYQGPFSDQLYTQTAFYCLPEFFQLFDLSQSYSYLFISRLQTYLYVPYCNFSVIIDSNILHPSYNGDNPLKRTVRRKLFREY